MSYVYILLDPRFPEKHSLEFITLLYRPIYVGKGTKERMFDHLFRNDKHPLTYKIKKLKKLYCKKYLKSFVIKIFDNSNHEDAYKHEIKIIEMFGRLDLKNGPLCNLEPGGRGGRQISEATKKKISLKLSGKNCYMFGVPKSEEIKNKISNTLKGTHLSDETKQKISNTMKNPSFQKIRYDENWSKTASKMQKGIRLCTWIVKDFNTNKEFTTSNLGEFCSNRDLIYETIRGSFKHKNPIKTGKCAGWKIISKTEWK